MNENHAEVCSSAEWAEHMRETVLPHALGGGPPDGAAAGSALGEDVLEIGPGYGPVTEILAGMLAGHGGSLTSVELDPELAARLAPRFPSVTVVRADAAALPFGEGRFSGAVCCTMLHHVPTGGHQDAIFAEVARVLRPGGLFAGSDSMDTEGRRAFHEGDVFNPVEPAELAGRLVSAGFVDAVVEIHDDRDWFSFHARRSAH